MNSKENLAEDYQRLHCIVQGYVQGVGYRYFVLCIAKDAGLTGWVKNLPSGEVEVVAEGDHSSLLQLIAELQRGPASAQVKNIITNYLPYQNEWQDFRILFF
jgi:acylphosphatase